MVSPSSSESQAIPVQFPSLEVGWGYIPPLHPSLVSQWQTCMPEILSEIFLSGNSPVWPKDIAYPPLRVCSSWRRTALATPKLWARINYDIALKISQKSFESFRWWLSMTEGKNVGMDITLWEQDEPDEEWRGPLLPFCEALLARAETWEYLQLDGYCEWLRRYFLIPQALSKATRLKELSITGTFDWEYVRDMRELRGSACIILPNIQRLSISSMYLALVPPIYAPRLVDITIRASNSSATRLQKMLKNSPLLSNLHICDMNLDNMTKAVDYSCLSLKSLTITDNPPIPQIFLASLCRNAPLLIDLVLHNSSIKSLGSSISTVFPFHYFRNTAEPGRYSKSEWAHIVKHSPNLRSLDTIYYSPLDLPTSFPFGLVDIRLDFLYGPWKKMQFDFEKLATMLSSLPFLKSLIVDRSQTFLYDEWDECESPDEDPEKEEQQAPSFTPFLLALAIKPNGALVCPQLRILKLSNVSFDFTALVNVSRLRTPSVLEHPLLEEHFRVTLTKCSLVPDVENASYLDLVTLRDSLNDELKVSHGVEVGVVEG